MDQILISKNPQKILDLLKLNPNLVYKRFNYNSSMLIFAASLNSIELFTYVYENSDLDINEIDNCGISARTIALANDYTEIFDYINKINSEFTFSDAVFMTTPQKKSWLDYVKALFVSKSRSGLYEKLI